MHEVRLTVSRLDDDGRGVGVLDGREIHVAGVLPGETARVVIEHESPHRRASWARLVALDAPLAPERVSPRCPGHGRCGGCALQHLSGAGQLALKRARVAAALASAGVASDALVLRAAPAPTHYRNRAKYVVAPAPAGGVRLCSFAPASHELVDMAGCQVVEPALAAAAARVAAWLGTLGLACHDERTHAGELRYVLLRADHAGRVLVLVVTHTESARTVLAARAAELLTAPDGATSETTSPIVGVTWQPNAATGGRVLGDAPAQVLAGVGALDEDVGQVRLRLSPEAFFQVHRAQAATLYADVAAALGAAPGVRLVDLYAGVGGFALTCAARGASVVGVELVAAAVDDARAVAPPGARFLCADAAAGLPDAAALLGGVDGLVVDPPRKGLGAATRAAVLSLAPPRLAVVFCEPAAITRDLPPLLAAGYRVADVIAYDLMPGTPEVETLVVLRR